MGVPVRLGVVGAGWFASRVHCPAVVGHAEAELVALCRRDPEQLRVMADNFAVEHTFVDYRELLDSGQLDGVIVCSPHHLHYQHALAALEAGLHVMVEKPVTLDPAQGRRLVELAAEKGLALVVGHNTPYWPHCRHLRQVVVAGGLGQIEMAHIHWVGNAAGVFGLEPLPDSLPGVVRPTSFRSDPSLNGGGYLIDGGCHLICGLLWCTGLSVKGVTAQMDNAQWDIRAVLGLELSNGALASLSCVADSQVGAKRHRELYFGSAGTATVSGVPFALSIEGTKGDDGQWTEAQLPAGSDPVDNLVDCMLGRDVPALAGEVAVHVVEVVNGAYEAARTGRRVQL